MMSYLSGPVVTFSNHLFGFDKEEVRACLRNMIADYEDARREIERLSINLEAVLASSGQPVRQEPTGVQVERVLAKAHKAAEDMKSDAEQAARQILREAQEEAAQVRSKAESDAAALRRTAASRMAALESEIQDLIDRRRVVQAMLDRAADRLNEIAQDMRETVEPAGASVQESSPIRTSAIV